MWKKGTFVIDGVSFSYEAKVFNKRSRFGIDDGRISKLNIVKDDGYSPCLWWENVVVHYDCGWNIQPKTELEKKALNYVLDIYK